MYLHIGNDVLIKEKAVIGIFNMDTGMDIHASRIFLSEAEKKKETVLIGGDIPKSFIVCFENKKQKVYLSPLASSTIKKRAIISLK